MLEPQRWGLACSAPGLVQVREKKKTGSEQAYRINTSPRELDLPRSAEAITRTAASGKIHSSYHLICLSLPSVTAATTFIFQGLHRRWDCLGRLLNHPYQPASLEAMPRDATQSNARWYLTLECPSSWPLVSCSKSNFTNILRTLVK